MAAVPGTAVVRASACGGAQRLLGGSQREYDRPAPTGSNRCSAAVLKSRTTVTSWSRMASGSQPTSGGDAIDSRSSSGRRQVCGWEAPLDARAWLPAPGQFRSLEPEDSCGSRIADYKESLWRRVARLKSVAESALHGPFASPATQSGCRGFRERNPCGLASRRFWCPAASRSSVTASWSGRSQLHALQCARGDRSRADPPHDRPAWGDPATRSVAWSSRSATNWASRPPKRSPSATVSTTCR